MLSDWETECPVCEFALCCCSFFWPLCCPINFFTRGLPLVKGDEGELQEDHFQFPSVSSGYEHSAVDR